jgi:hypothetical protein
MRQYQDYDEIKRELEIMKVIFVLSRYYYSIDAL